MDEPHVPPATDRAELMDPPPERQAELNAQAAANRVAGRPPYTGVALRTRGELVWVLRERGWSGEREARGRDPADLRGINLDGMDLSGARLDRADLSAARLDGINLRGARLHSAMLKGASIRNAALAGAQLNSADLTGARLDRADLSGADMDGADFSGAVLGHANLSGASADRAIFHGTSLGNATLKSVCGDNADFAGARLRGASLVGARLRGASFNGARLWESDFSHADIISIDLSGAHLRGANLKGADLRGARLDTFTQIGRVLLDNTTQLGDCIWNGAILTQVDWDQIPRLGDERLLLQPGTRPERRQRLREAARAYRGLVTALRGQGMVAEASSYRLREQQLERRALWLDRRLGAWFFSALLELVSGYGERPGRAFIAYIATVLTFAVGYFAIGHLVGPTISPFGSLLFSLTSFHGRGFFPANNITLENPLTALAAVEAVIGLFIELIFIAAFSRRFLGE